MILTATGAVVVAPVETVSGRDLEAVLPAASVTLNPNVLVPALAGVPERTPDVDQASPVLQEPEQEAIAQV